MTKKVRKYCWRCNRRLVITKLIQLTNQLKKRGLAETQESIYLCKPCANDLKKFLNSVPLG